MAVPDGRSPGPGDGISGVGSPGFGSMVRGAGRGAGWMDLVRPGCQPTKRRGPTRPAVPGIDRRRVGATTPTRSSSVPSRRMSRMSIGVSRRPQGGGWMRRTDDEQTYGALMTPT
jgi:hypothetical protein